MMSVCTKDSLICFGDRAEGEWDWCVRGDFHECYNFLLLNFLLLLFLFFWFNFFFFLSIFLGAYGLLQQEPRHLTAGISIS